MSGAKSALWNDETMTDEFVKQAKAFVAENWEKPFFLYFASQCIQVPRAPNKRFQGKTDLGYRGDAMVEFDRATGEIMKVLEEHGLTKNTIVIFSSDSGPVYDDGYAEVAAVKKSQGEADRGHHGSGIYRSGKYQIYEGGTRVPRVPSIIRWPARIQPGVSDALVNQIDFLASVRRCWSRKLRRERRETAGTRFPRCWDNLRGACVNDRGVLFPGVATGGVEMRRETGKSWSGPAHPASLYYLAEDSSEATDLIQLHPERAEAMTEKLRTMKEAKGIWDLNL